MELYPKLQNQSLECIRVAGEKKYYERFIEMAKAALIGMPIVRRRSFEAARLELMSESLRLTEKSAPGLHGVMKRALANLFHPDTEYDLFQVTGDENAWTEPFEAHPLVTLQGRMMTMLDDGAMASVIGHELGHCFCHSDASEFSNADAIRLFLLDGGNAYAGVSRDKVDALKRVASAFCQCRELTADRAGLLAVRDLDACLRLQMITMTGLASDALTWDCEAFMAQAEVIVDEIRKNGAPISTHPCAGFRAWATAKFAETDVYRALTGKGSGSIKLAELDREIDELFEANQLSEEDLDSDEIPLELLCFALCACFLMAWVDGEFSDREADFLQKTFARLIPDYQKYFDIKVTCQTLDELTPYVRQCSMPRKIDLFFMLYLLIEADGFIDEREMRLLLIIGKQLGCCELWTTCLEALCRKTKCSCPPPEVRSRIYNELQDDSNALLGVTNGVCRSLGCENAQADGASNALVVAEFEDEQDTIAAYFEDICAEPSVEMEGIDAEDSPRVISSIPRIKPINKQAKRPSRQRSQKEETEKAIALFCSNVQRRGCSRTTLARLLRLAGMKSADRASAVELYREVFKQYEIVAEPELNDQMSLQDVIVLKAMRPTKSEDTIEISVESPTAALIRAFARLQASQVSGNGRSQSVRCKAEKTGRAFDLTRLNHIAHGRTERVLESLEAEKDVVAISPAEAGRNQFGIDISNAMEALYREMKARAEEQGASHLYVGSSFISGSVAGYEVCAPLLLRGVELKRMDGGVSGWTLAVNKGGSAKVNYAVLRMIAGKKGTAFTEDMVEKLDEAASSGDEALTACVDELGFFMGVRGGGAQIEVSDDEQEDAQYEADSDEIYEEDADAPTVTAPVMEEDTSVSDALYAMSKRTPVPEYRTEDWLCMESCAMLGFFPQSNSETLRDYGEILKELQTMSRPVGEILGSLNHVLPHDMADSLELTREAGESDEGAACTVEFDTNESPELPLVSLDPSQLAAMKAARTEEALVIDGPPGTGKSQVIVGIVLDALSRGLKVAVVSDKRAALDVVAQRLTANDFGDIYGIVYDVNKDRSALFASIAARIAKSGEAAPSTFDQSEFDALMQQYQAMYSEMNEQQKALKVSDGEFTAAQYAEYLAALRNQMEIAQNDENRAFAGCFTQADASNPLLLHANPEISSESVAEITAISPHNLGSLRETLTRFLPYRDLYDKNSWWRGHLEMDFLSALPDFTSFVDGMKPYGEDIRSCLGKVDDGVAHAVGVDVAAETWYRMWRSPEQMRSPERLCTPWGELGQTAEQLRSELDSLGRHMACGDALSEQKLSDFREFTRYWKDNREELLNTLSDLNDLRAFPAEQNASAEQVLENWSKIWGYLRDNQELKRDQIVLPWKQMFDMSAEMLASYRSFFRFFRPSYWKLKKNINLWYERNLPSARPDKLSNDRLSEIRDRATQYVKAQKLFVPNMSSASLGLDTLSNVFDSFDTKKTALMNWFEAHCPESVPAKIDDEALRQAGELARNNRSIQEQLNPCVPIENLGLGVLSEELHDKSDKALQLRHLREECSAILNCVPAVAEQFFDLARDDQSVDDLEKVWQTGASMLWAEGRMKALCERDASILSLCGNGPRESGEDLIARYKRLETALIERSRTKLREDLLKRGILATPRPQPRARRTPEQKILEAIIDEASKKTRHKTLRTFLHAHAENGVLDILPVWLLSPETMTVLFPRKPVFDLIIFDEASQATVASSLPALLRAKRWIIAGDDKQMPPSSFFSAPSKTEEKASNEDADKVSISDVFDSESLLTLARSRAKHTRLSWHYRSQHDALIAFSNYAFYDGDLKTVPAIPDSSVDGQLPPDSPERLLRWVAVPNAHYDKGCNPIEAARMAELLYESLKTRPNESVGMITFNINQRNEVMDAIDRLCRNCQEFAVLYNDAQQLPIDRRPFVKSIENVQGDERDAIFFSLGHCAVARKGQASSEARVPARFGPLGQKGGERRLNVAISRAKIRSTIVASFEPHQLAIGNVRNPGPAYFKLFVEFMWAAAHDDIVTRDLKLSEAQRLMQGEITEKEEARSQALQLPDNISLAAMIAREAERAGYEIEQNVGIGPFKIPLALFKPGQQPVAVLIQNENVLNAYDASIHRPSMLISKGWRVIETNAVEWLGMRDKVMAQL